MKLGLRLTTSLKLAPQLIQSLKMLQMPVLKLEQTIRHELATNPMLEEVEELEPGDTEATDEKESELDERDSVDWDEYLFEDDEGYKVRGVSEQPEERFEGSAAHRESLYEHLMEQLAFLKLSEDDRLIGEYILGNISPNGYLTITVDEMAEELEVDAESIEKMLLMVQGFDPVGVGSRDLRESLLIQLKTKEMEGSLAWRIVHEHIQELDRKSITQLARLMSVPAERAQGALEIIKSLAPVPVQGRFDAGAIPVVPDLVIERFGEEFHVLHNDANIPRLRINAGYRALMKRGGTSTSETKQYIRQKLEQARWLLNSINQRRTTMVRVMEAIIVRQKDFFENGPAFLRPLIMDEIAQDVEMNVATISRVSSGKYVQTPYGVNEIKYFFNSGIAREDGTDLTKRSVKQRLKEIIEAEPQDKPYSDQEIHRRLNAEGIKLARRTVTKYREELNIRSARLRKRVV